MQFAIYGILHAAMNCPSLLLAKHLPFRFILFAYKIFTYTAEVTIFFNNALAFNVFFGNDFSSFINCW